MLLLSVSLLCCVPHLLPGEEPAILLVETEPLRATVSIDGSPVTHVSPVIIRNLSPGNRTVTLTKEGFETTQRIFLLESGGVHHLSVRLTPNRFLLSLPESERTEILDTSPEAPYLRLPEGDLRVERDSETLSLEPIFPRQDLLDGVTLTMPIVAALTATVAALEWSEPREPVPRISPAVGTGFGLTIGLFGAAVALHVQRERYLRDYSYLTEERTSREADLLMEEIDEFITRGDLDGAQGLLARFLREHQQDIRIPEILYMRAQLFLVSGEVERARSALMLLVTSYPTRDYFDRSVTLLANIEVERGDPAAANRLLEQRLFFDSYE